MKRLAFLLSIFLTFAPPVSAQIEPVEDVDFTCELTAVLDSTAPSLGQVGDIVTAYYHQVGPALLFPTPSSNLYSYPLHHQVVVLGAGANRVLAGSGEVSEVVTEREPDDTFARFRVTLQASDAFGAPTLQSGAEIVRIPALPDMFPLDVRELNFDYEEGTLPGLTQTSFFVSDFTDFASGHVISMHCGEPLAPCRSVCDSDGIMACAGLPEDERLQCEEDAFATCEERFEDPALPLCPRAALPPRSAGSASSASSA